MYFSNTAIRLVLASVIIVASMANSSQARAVGSPDVVGILAMITEPANANELGLNQDQLDRLLTVIKQHEGEALTVASQLRELPAAERRVKMFERIRTIERQGMAILTDSQQKIAESWRLQKLGFVALMEDEVAKRAGLSEEQVAKLKNIQEGRTNLVREMGLAKATAEINKRMEEVLSPEQRTAWLEMSGMNAKSESAEETSAVVTASPDAESSSNPSRISGPNDGLVLNFNAAPWSDVLKWLAKEAELSLQADAYPAGTFTYRDPYRTYSVSETMDIMNSVLLGKGYTLIKKHRVLMSVDLGSGESAEVVRGLIRELAELVDPAELDSRGEYEIVKSLFVLERTEVDDAEKEVKLLVGPHGSVVPMPSAGQILVTETAGKLRIIRDTIQRSEKPDGVRAAKIVTLGLKYVSADEVLMVARPLLGLKEGVNTSDDISVSTDTFGNMIFATGTSDKLQKLRDIVTQIDAKPSEEATTATTAEQPYFKSHRLQGSDPTTTMDVLQSMFSGQSNIRLGQDPKTNNILAMATKSDHEAIEKLIAEQAAQGSDFEIIQLTKMDTQAAILTLEKFYGKQSKDKDPNNVKGPIFYGDASSRRIMIKGTKEEVEQVRSLLAKVEEADPGLGGLTDGMIVMPYTGKSAERMLNQIDLLMQATKNRSRIRVIKPKGAESGTKETSKSLRPNSKDSSAEEESPRVPHADFSTAPNPFERFALATVPVSADAQDSASQTQEPATVPVETVSLPSNEDVTIFQGPNGMIITSEDPETLKKFNQLARLAEEQMAAGPSEPSVIYLQHIRASAAAELVRSVIAGEVASGGGGGLLGDVASSVLGGGLFGGMFGGGSSGSSAGSSAVSGNSTSGDVIIIPDPRLNALWIQANPIDMQLVEQLIEIIDQPDSPVENMTRGSAQAIFVDNVPVADIEATVKQVFADRIAQPAGAGAQRQPSPQDFIDAIRQGAGGGRRGGGSGQSELKEMTMTVSSDKKNNALIVVAPPQLFKEVERLVKQMDESAGTTEESVIVVPIGGEVNSTLMQSALSSVFGSSAKTTTASATNATTNASGGDATPGGNPADFLQQFRNRGGRGNQGGGFPGGGFPGGGAPGGGFPGGGGNFRGGQGNPGRGGNPFGGGATGNQGGGNRNRGGNR